MNYEKRLEENAKNPDARAAEEESRRFYGEARRRAILRQYKEAHAFPVFPEQQVKEFADAETLERIRADLLGEPQEKVPAHDPEARSWRQGETRVTNAGGGVKADGGKPEMDLIPPAFLEQTAAVLTYGAHKYAANNWMKVERRRYVAALMRHLCRELRDPKGIDDESGFPHTAHIAANIAIIIGLDDLEERKCNK